MTVAKKINQATVKVVPALLDRAGPTLSMNTVKCLYNGFIALNRPNNCDPKFMVLL